MSNARGDWMRDRIATARRLLECEEKCEGGNFLYNPFSCETVSACLFDKCEELEQKLKELE